MSAATYSLQKRSNNSNALGFFEFVNKIYFNESENRNNTSSGGTSAVETAEADLATTTVLKHGLYISSQWDVAEYLAFKENKYNTTIDVEQRKYCTDFIQITKSIVLSDTALNSVNTITENVIDQGLNTDFAVEVYNTLRETSDNIGTPYFEFLFPLRLTPMNCDMYKDGDEMYSACVEYPILHFRIYKLHNIVTETNIKNEKDGYVFHATTMIEALSTPEGLRLLHDDEDKFDVSFRPDTNISFGDQFDCRIIFPKYGNDKKTLIFYSQIISACTKLIDNTLRGPKKSTIDSQEVYIKGLLGESIVFDSNSDQITETDDWKKADDSLLDFEKFNYSFQIKKELSGDINLNIKLEVESGSRDQPYKIKDGPFFIVSNSKNYFKDSLNKTTKSDLRDSDFSKKILINKDFNLEYFVKGKKYNDELNLEYYSDNSGFKNGFFTTGGYGNAITTRLTDLEDISKESDPNKKVQDFKNYVNAWSDSVRWDLIRLEYYSYRERDKDNVKRNKSNIDQFLKINALHANYFEQTNFSNTLQTVCFSKNMLGYYAIELPTSINNLLYKEASKNVYQVDLRTLYKLILKDIIGVSVSSAD